MSCIHAKKVNKLSECNSLHDIINPPECTKVLNSRYSPIIQGCMNKWKGEVKFKNFWILLEIGCSSIILMWIIIKKLLLKKTMWCSGTCKRVRLLPI